MKLSPTTRVSVTLPISSPGRCPDCGALSLVYLGDPLATGGLWKCPCGWRQLGKAPREKPVMEYCAVPPDPVDPRRQPNRAAYVGEPCINSGLRKSVPFRPADGPRSTPLLSIVIAVCKRCYVLPPEMIEKCRHKRVVMARRLIVPLARSLTRCSFPEIAQVMSPHGAYSQRANHSTAITVMGKFLAWKDNQVIDLLAKDDPERHRFGQLTLDELYWEIRKGLVG